jgi:4-hydroxyphenylacetate decarboxylase large subunit
MGRKLSRILDESGIPMNFRVGGAAPTQVTDREVRREPCPRAGKLRDLHFQAYSSATNEFPYWYTRKYMELDNEVPVIRRALALGYAFSHLTPVYHLSG